MQRIKSRVISNRKFMRKIFFVSLILFAVLSFGFDCARAQDKTENALFVELHIPDKEVGEVSHKFAIPNDFDFESSFIGGAFATVGCIDCLLTSEYQFYLFKAEKIESEETKIGFILEFEHKPSCNTQKEITIDQNKKETFKLKCGISVTTHYAPYIPKEQNKRKLKNTPDLTPISPKP